MSHHRVELRLRWFRFDCSPSRLQAILEFYLQCMKFSMETQTESANMIKTDFLYPGDNIGIRFVTDKINPEKYRSHSKQNNSNPSNHSGGQPTKAVGIEFIVIYVTNLHEIISKIKSSKIGHVYTEITEISPGIQCAVVLDPLGLKLRLFQSAEFFPWASNKLSARLAYVSIPINSYDLIENNVKFYEETFLSYSFAANSAFSMLHAAKQPNKAFRCVDLERFDENLKTLVWLGNDSRKKQPSLCLSHTISSVQQQQTVQQLLGRKLFTDHNSPENSDQRDTSTEHHTNNAGGEPSSGILNQMHNLSEVSESLFLGLSFFVNDLENCISLVKRAELINSSQLAIKVEPGFPRFVSFYDCCLINIEISDDLSAHQGLSSPTMKALYASGQQQFYSLSAIKQFNHSLNSQINENWQSNANVSRDNGSSNTSSTTQSPAITPQSLANRGRSSVELNNPVESSDFTITQSAAITFPPINSPNIKTKNNFEKI
jgi:hypothetical protein